jgi:hypothetical protein
VLASVVGLTLATAGQTFAADSVVPILQAPPLPEVTSDTTFAAADDTVPPTVPEATVPDATPAEQPITVSVEADAGNIDVSVRILSPGRDEDTASDAAETTVVSDSGKADITSDPALPEPSSDATPDDAPSTGSNTNVTVRVLSPGDNGPVAQGRERTTTVESALVPVESGTEDAETPEADEDEAAPESIAPGADNSPIPPKVPEQYQSADSQYQSDEQLTNDAWIWIWYLALDCDGNTDSSSREAGSQSSLDWTWMWEWEWACNSPPHPPPTPSLETVLEESPPASKDPSDAAAASTASVTETPTGDGEPQAPWLWTWTFTFCGETVTAVLPIDTQTALRWAWEWTWTWTCELAARESTDTTGDSSPFPVDGAATEPSGETPGSAGTSTGQMEAEPGRFPGLDGRELPLWVISLVPFDELTSIGTTRVVPVFVQVTAIISGELDFGAQSMPPPFVAVAAPTRTSLGQAVTPDSGVISPRGLGAPPAVRPVAGPTPIGTAGEPARARPRAAQPRIVKASPRAKRASMDRRSGDAPLFPWPPLRPFQAAGGPGASSSFVPGVSVLGTAALVALFILAAPGLGRRIRVARELRPRGTYGTSIDHPG